MNRAADLGQLQFQICAECEKIQYPPRELCERCLADQLAWQAVPDGGSIISFTVLHTSYVEFFRTAPPWHIGLVKLDCGPTVFAHLSESVLEIGARVRTACLRDHSGQAVFLAVKPKEDARRLFKHLFPPR